MVKKITIRDRIDAVIKWIVLIVAGVFTAFPFFWMIVSALKTKAEIMDTSHFFPETMQWSNFASILFDSPILYLPVILIFSTSSSQYFRKGIPGMRIIRTVCIFPNIVSAAKLSGNQRLSGWAGH